MFEMKTLRRQHGEIYDAISGIKNGMEMADNVAESALDLAQKINLLSGKLKIHLGTEDRFMYPHIMENGSDELKKTAGEYVAEMGAISHEFSIYKNRFNTRYKIINDTQNFKSETKRILKVLEDRMKKEDANLYKYL